MANIRGSDLRPSLIDVIALGTSRPASCKQFSWETRKGDTFKKRLGEFKKRLSQILLPWPAGAAGMGRGVALVCVSLALHAGADHLRSRGHQLAARPHAPGPSAPPK